MRKGNLILLLVAVLAMGVLVAGCGSDDSSSTEVTVEDSNATTTEAGGETSVTSDSGGVDTDAFLNECTDAVAGTPAESTGTSVCQQAADALEQCAGQANDDSAAIAICQSAADEAVKQLQAAG